MKIFLAPHVHVLISEADDDRIRIRDERPILLLYQFNCLFRDYLLPFEIISVLLLVAMVGVILLSKKELK